MIPNIVKGRGITGALAYVMGQGEDENGKRIELVPGEKSRADILGAQNIGFEIESAADLDLARRMMEWNGKEENQASKWRKCEKDCLHASLSWEPGQNPTRDEMIAAAQGFLKELGMETAQAIFVAHDDTAHKHLHIVASRIDPLTGKTFSQADDFTKAQPWGLTYEREHGQIPQNELRRALHRIVDAIEARDGAGVVEALTERVPTFTARELDKALSYGRLSKEERATFRDEILASGHVIGLRETARAPVSALHDARGLGGGIGVAARHPHACRRQEPRSRRGADRQGERRLHLEAGAGRGLAPPHPGRGLCHAVGRGRNRQEPHPERDARRL